MTPSPLFSEPSPGNCHRPASLPTKDHIKSLTVHARQAIILDLSKRLDGMSSLAEERDRQELKRMLSDLSVSFRDSAAELAAASYGPLMIEQMSASVDRIEQSLAH